MCIIVFYNNFNHAIANSLPLVMSQLISKHITYCGNNFKVLLIVHFIYQTEQK